MNTLVGERSAEAAVELRDSDRGADPAVRYRNQAIVLLQEGRLAESERHSREALGLRPDDVDILNVLGLALWRQGARRRPRRSTFALARSSRTTTES